MSRQLELLKEEREVRRRTSLVRALEYELPGTLEVQGIILTGFSMKWDAYECLMTIRADVGGTPSKAFVGAGSPIDCILKAVQAGKAERLRWSKDQYKPSTA